MGSYNLIKTNALAATFTTGPRLAGLLSDGTSVVVIIDDDSGTTKLMLYYSTDTYRTTWTRAINFAPAATPGGVSMAIDVNDNIYLTYRVSGSTVLKYLKLSKGGGNTWTAGSEETVFTPPGGSTIWAIDIDVLDGTNQLVLVGVRYHDSGSNSEKTGFYVRKTTSPAWVDSGFSVTWNTGTTDPNYNLSVCRDSGSTTKAAWACAGTAGVPVRIGVLTVTASTGAATNSYITQTAFNSQTGQTGIQLYASDSNEWTIVAHVDGSGGLGGSSWAGRFSATAFVITPVEVVATPNRFYVPAFGFLKAGDASIQKVLVIGSYNNDDANPQGIHGRIGTIVGTSLTWGPVFSWEKDVPQVSLLFGGNNRNFSVQKIDFLIMTQSKYYHRFNLPPWPPESVGPTGTVTTDTPTLSATMNYGSPRAKLEWRLALDSGFSSEFRAVYEPDSDYTFSGIHTKVVPDAVKLHGGTWYLRAISVDEFGTFNLSTITTFNVYHQPSQINLSPSGGNIVGFGSGTITFDWDFSSSSPTQQQTAYQIIVEVNGTGASVADTGKVYSSISLSSIAISASYKNIALRWKMRVWDSGDTAGNYSEYQVFTLSDAPTVAINTPANASTVTTSAPTVTWTPSFSGGRTQKEFRVSFIKTSDSSVVYDSGWITGTVTSFTPPGSPLTNATGYTVRVDIRDTANLQAIDTHAITTSWAAPDPRTVTIDVTPYDTLGFVRLSWAAGTVDAEFAGWRVYRRVTGSTTWTLLASVSGNTGTITYDDRFAGSGVSYDYDVRQLATRFGATVESDSTSVTGTPMGDHYWIIHPTNLTYDTILYNVTEDNYDDEFDSSEIKLLGRGRKMEYGDRWGYAGTLVMQIRDQTGLTSREAIQRIKAIKDLLTHIYIRNPFGDVWLVDVDDISISRMAGVGNREFGTVTIPYKELSA